MTTSWEPASRFTVSIVSLQAEQPALKTSIFFLLAILPPLYSLSPVVSSRFNQSCFALSQREQLIALFVVVPWGHAFHNDATTNNPTAPYNEGLDSHSNLATITPTAATNPTTNGPYP